MNQPFIIVEYVLTETLEKILHDFVLWYEDPSKVIDINIYRRKGNDESFLLTFEESADLDMFSFLIYYLRYPIKVYNHDPVVYGFYKAIEIKENFISGNWAMIYINPDDPAPDKSYFITDDGAHYIKDFSSGIERLETPGEPFNFINADVNDYHHIITVTAEQDMKATEVNPEAKPWWKFW